MNDDCRPKPDLTRTALAVLFIFLLIAAGVWILRPFAVAFLWATMIVIATWPLLQTLQTILWNKRAPAVAVMTVLLLTVFVLPFSLAITTIVGKADEIVGWVKSLGTISLPQPPAFLDEIPVIGPKLAESWQQFAVLSSADLSALLGPYGAKLMRWFLDQAGSVGAMVLQFLLTVIIAVILYANGEAAAAGVRLFARRLAGDKGEEAAALAGKAVRGVAMGVVVTAIIQSGLGGLGLAVAGIPAAAVLTAVMFMLCIAQIGPSLVMAASVFWLFYKSATVWAIALLVWSIPVLVLDNLLRPALIRKGANLPLLLIFAGVIGGLLAIGIIGLFIGPVILAVTYTLLRAWVLDDPTTCAEAGADKDDPP